MSECFTKLFPNGTLNSLEYEDCVLQLSKEYSDMEPEYNKYVVTSQGTGIEESILNEGNTSEYDKNPASCLCAFNFSSVFLIFVCLLLI